MKRILSVIMILLTLSAVTIAATSHFLVLQEGNADGVEIYSSDGSRLDALSEIDESGMVIRTEGEAKEFISEFGSIHLQGDSLLAVTGFDISAPSLYLLYGEATIDLKADLPVSIYTPSSMTELPGPGEYMFVSTDDEETVYNFSDSTITVMDGLRGTEDEVGPMETLRLMDWPRNAEEVPAAEYYALSMTGSRTIFDETNTPEEPAALPEPVVRTYTYGGYTLTATIDSGKAVLEYPGFITDSDIDAFFAIENERYGLGDLGVRYTIDRAGQTTLSYPAAYSNEAAAAELDMLVEDLIAYLTAPAPEPEAPEAAEPEAAVPSAPAIISPIITLEPEVPAVPVMKEPSVEILEEAAEPEAPGIIEPEIAIEPEGSTDEAASGEIAAAEEAAEPVMAEGDSIPAPVITGTLPEKKPVFDIRLAARAYADQSGLSSVNASIQPYLTYGSFILGLNIDPFSIYDAVENASSITDWIGFATDFISEMKYRSLDESTLLSIDRYTYLEGDSIGLFTGLDHGWDGVYSALSLDHRFSSEFYGHRIWADDLSFRAHIHDESGLLTRWSLAGAEISVSAGDAYPLTLTIGATALITPDSIEDSDLYPLASLYVPFCFSPDLNVGLRAGAATVFMNGEFGVNPFKESGMLLSFMIPVEYRDFTFEAGAAYSTGSMHYGFPASYAYYPLPGDYVTVRMKAAYEGRWFGLRAEGWLDLEANGGKTVPENSWVDASAYIDLWGFRLFGGFRTAFEDVQKQAEYYGGISSSYGPVETRLQLGYNDISKFSLTFAGSVSAFGHGKEETGYEPEIPVVFDLETGMKHYIGRGGMPIFLITPRVTIGSGDYQIALRAPLQITFADKGGADHDFVLAGFDGRPEWNFGQDETDRARKAYRIFSDIMPIIDSITLGDVDDTILYLIAERGYYKSGTLFSDFGSEDSLSIRAGFNFPNLSLALYLDNAENPRITEFSLSFFPTEDYDLAFSINVPGQMLFKDSKNYSIIYYPEFRIDIPFVRNQFRISLFALGELSSVYVNGTMERSRVIYDFQNKAMYDYMAGAEFALDLHGFGFSAQGGIRSGSITPDLFNIFTDARHDIISQSEKSGNPMKYFGKVSFGYTSDIISIGLSYTVSDFEALFKAEEAGDLIYLTLSSHVTESFTLYGSVAKDGFSSSFRDAKDFWDYVNKDLLFTLGADFDFGHVGFTTELKAEYLPGGESDYINVPQLSPETAVSLTVKTRFAF